MATVDIGDDQLLALYAGGVVPRVLRALERIEEKMTEISGALADQSQAISALAERIDSLDAGALQEQVNTLTAALDEERAAHTALRDLFEADEVADEAALAEATERVTQAEAATAEARTQLDATTTELVAGVEGVQANTARIAGLAQPATPEEPEEPQG